MTSKLEYRLLIRWADGESWQPAVLGREYWSRNDALAEGQRLLDRLGPVGDATVRIQYRRISEWEDLT